MITPLSFLRKTRLCDSGRTAIAAAVGLVAMFVAAQSLIAVHAAKYGGEMHSHDGAPCVVAMVAQGADKTMAAAAVAFVAMIITWRLAGATAQTERARIFVRAAHPRGPPSR